MSVKDEHSGGTKMAFSSSVPYILLGITLLLLIHENYINLDYHALCFLKRH